MIRFRLKELMEQKGVTYRQLSSSAKVSTSILNKMVQEKPRPVQTDVINRLLNYFGCELTDFVVYVPDNGQPSIGATHDLEMNSAYTGLGRELFAIRKDIEASGEQLLTEEELEQEITERRGERV